MADDEQVAAQPSLTCGTPNCGRELQGEAATLDQSQGSIAATAFRCECGFACIEPVRPTRLVLKPWKAK